MFRDPSIGNQVKVETVKLMSLTGQSFGSSRHQEGKVSATEVLTSFCQWQTRLNQYQAGPLLYDVALLVTRENICSEPGGEGEGCEALGLAELGTVCSEQSCALIQDNGLTSAFTIAHELGHV